MAPRLPAHRVTTAHMGAAYPFQAERGLSSRGVFIGRDVHSGGGFSYDPWALYPDTITGHNMAVFGVLGSRKSTLCKTYCARQVIFGRQVCVLDPKPEYEPLCQAVGGVYVSLRPGGSVRLNPLEALIRDRRPEAIHRARMDLMLPLTEAALGRALRPAEQTGVDGAVRLSAVAADAEHREPTLRDVLEALFEPGAGLAAHMRMPAADTRTALREAAYALRRLVDGDLAGMFDGPSTGGIDLEAPIVAFDLSRVTDTTSLGVVMICVSAWLRRLLAEADDGVRRIIVYDEAWKVLRVPGVARFLNESWKMARQWGVQNVAVMHRLSDLASVGDAGSEAIELAKGLLSDSQTRVVYQQASNELGNMRELLQLNEREVAAVSGLSPGMALWKVGQRSFVVEHLVSRAERWIVDTEPRDEEDSPA
jgi:type IV secretory pathway VirB4 component